MEQEGNFYWSVSYLVRFLSLGISLLFYALFWKWLYQQLGQSRPGEDRTRQQGYWFIATWIVGALVGVIVGKLWGGAEELTTIGRSVVIGLLPGLGAMISLSLYELYLLWQKE